MAVDRKVALIREQLVRDGLDKNTVVIFMGDHGRAMPRSKQWVYESGVSIPLIIYWSEGNSDLPQPAQYKRGSVSNQQVQSIDVSATTLAFGGVKKPSKMQGRVFLGDQAEPARNYTYAGRDRGDETVLMIRTVRGNRYRYIRNKYPERPFLELNRYKEASYPIIGLMRELHLQGKLSGPPAILMQPHRPAEELYLLEEDPYEINNLIHSPEHARVANRLRQKLDEWQDEIGDKGRIEEPDEIPAFWEAQMVKAYSKRLAERSKDWYKSADALGPYKID
jgi:uncharacterized sulfatase